MRMMKYKVLLSILLIALLQLGTDINIFGLQSPTAVTAPHQINQDAELKSQNSCPIDKNIVSTCLDSNLAILDAPISEEVDENEKYSSIKISNGYAKLSEAGLNVTKGVTMDMMYEANVVCTTEGAIQQLIDENAFKLDNQQLKFIRENSSFTEKSKGADLLCGIIGLKLAKNWNKYNNSFFENFNSVDDLQKEFIKNLYNIASSDYTIKCRVHIRGTSFIPAEVFPYIRITRLEFSDGKTLKILNTDKPFIADSSLNTRGIVVLPETQIDLNPLLDSVSN